MNLVTKTQKKYIAPKTKSKFNNFLVCLTFPLIGLLFLIGGSVLGGKPIFSDSVLNNQLMLTILGVLLACFALNTNLNSGRMDFSLGAVGILSCVLSWQILPESLRATQLFPVYLILLSLVLGTVIGLISGLVFTWLKIPAIVVSLGLCLIYEGFASILVKGEGSINMGGDIVPYYNAFMTNVWFIIAMIVIVSVIMLIVLKYSKFGHDKLSILFGQKVAVDTGINEIKNAIICYGLAGALIALYTLVDAASTTQIKIPVNLGSAMSVMKNFLPIFLGGLIAKRSNEVIGLFLGIVTVSLFKTGLTRYGVNPSTISLIESILIFVVLTYMVNWTNWVNAVKNKIHNYKLSKIERK